MKADFSTKLLDLDGDEIPLDATPDKDGKPKDATPVTLRLACQRAICSHIQGDDLKPEEAFKRLELARRMNQEGEQEITAEESVLICTRAAKVWAIEIAGQVYELLKG